MSEQNARKLGFTDAAATKDQFEITDYIGGLATFIEECNTPMTISIQGSWGTGKTSIMNLVNNSLTKDDSGKELVNSKVKTIWFNTWQFSQFDMDEQLATSLLSSLISEFELENTKTKQEAKGIITKLKFGGKMAATIGKDLLVAYAESKIGGHLAEKLNDGIEHAKDKAVEELEKNSNGFELQQSIIDEYMDTTSAIKKLREAFAECVSQTLKEKKKEKIVVFIDDLDRLEPRKAVELLEVLKIFLDCEKCVFVLAIDYDVVVKGVEAKYGDLSNNKENAEEKGRSFFDKIIQVPFKMPIARYNITNYVKECFRQIGMPFASDKEIEIYENLIKSSIGTNPRAMKRLFNSFQLLTIIVPERLKENEKGKQLLFATLCLQYCNEKIYNFIVRNSTDLSQKQYQAIAAGNMDNLYELTEDKSELEEITSDDLSAANPFMALFSKAMDLNGGGDIDETEFKIFKEVIGFSAITSANDNLEKTDKKRNKPQPINIDEFEFKYEKYNSLDDLQKLLAALSNVIDDYFDEPEGYKYKNGCSVLWNAKNNNKNNISINERKGGFAIAFQLVPEKMNCLPQNVKALLDNKNLNIYDYNKCQYFQMVVKHTSTQDFQDLKEIAEGYISALNT